MTYLEIKRFYYKNANNNVAEYYLEVRGKQVGSNYYKATATDSPNPGAPAVSEINFDITQISTQDEYQDVYLGNLTIGTDKTLTVKTHKDGEDEDTDMNYDDAEEGN